MIKKGCLYRVVGGGMGNRKLELIHGNKGIDAENSRRRWVKEMRGGERHC